MSLFGWFRHPPRPRPPIPPPQPPPPIPDPDPVAPTPGPGGLQLACEDTSVRPMLVLGDAAAFLPEQAGGFTFPAPYNTIGVRVTDPRAGEVLPCGYAYWRRINRHDGLPWLRVLVGRQDACALLATVDKTTLQVEWTELVDVWGTGEQWYWDATDPDCFYLMDGPALVRYDVIDRSRTPVMTVGENLWQPHSSARGPRHSATVKDANYDVVSAAVGFGSGVRVIPIAVGGYDECQIDKTGQYLVVKEGDDNRILDLDGGAESLIVNRDGAFGHSDNGPGYIVGENDYHALPGAFEMRDLSNPIAGPRTLVYHTTDWQAMPRHIGIAWDRQTPIAILSSCCRVNVPRSNELVIAPLDGSQVCTVIAPAMVNLDAGATPIPNRIERRHERRKMLAGKVALSDYAKSPMANIDPIGEWVCWSANPFGRTELFLVRVP